MRVIFSIRNTYAQASSDFEHWLTSMGVQFVTRTMSSLFTYKPVWIVSKGDWLRYIQRSEFIVYHAKWFEVTSCNKQYVTECGIGYSKYLGSMCQVDRETAYAHSDISRDNWFLLDGKAFTYWIAEKRNPNKCVTYTSEPRQYGRGLVEEMSDDLDAMDRTIQRVAQLAIAYGASQYKVPGLREAMERGHWPVDPRAPVISYVPVVLVVAAE